MKIFYVVLLVFSCFIFQTPNILNAADTTINTINDSQEEKDVNLIEGDLIEGKIEVPQELLQKRNDNQQPEFVNNLPKETDVTDKDDTLNVDEENRFNRLEKNQAILTIYCIVNTILFFIVIFFYFRIVRRNKQ
ncbi:MAG: hypothetical protein AAB400_05445 [Patescibacteria group bacterium]